MVLCDCPVGPPIGPTLAATCGGGSFMLFMGLLEVFLRSQCDLEDPCGRPKVKIILNLNLNQNNSTLVLLIITRQERNQKQITIL